MFSRSLVRLSLLPVMILASLWLAACSHYQLGTKQTARFHTLFIAPVTNPAALPQAQAVVTTQLREAFLKDNRIVLVDSPSAADAVLQISLARYHREMVVSRSDDTGLARRYEISLEALATLKDNRSQEIYFRERSLNVKRGAFTDNGLIPAEYQLLPLLAERLATEAVHATLDIW